MKFKILNIKDKIPEIDSIILTTSEEINKLKIESDVIDIIPYNLNEGMEKYIFKVIAAYRLGYRGYTQLTFSIDPGLNHIGVVIFLDDFYLNSHTLMGYKKVLNMIKLYQKAIQEDNLKQVKMQFKFGRGIIEISPGFINEIFKVFSSEKLKVSLIDEKNSSKIRISYKGGKFPKHESSALILAFREGLEVNLENYQNIFSQIKRMHIQRDAFYPLNDKKYQKKGISEIAERVLTGEISLTESTSLIANLDNFI